jgi:hypothetical protein
MQSPYVSVPTLSQRRLELGRLELSGATIQNRSGRELRYRFSVSPGEFSRFYDCLLSVRPGFVAPDVFVLQPDLSTLSGGRRLPHTYGHKGRGTQLCLFLPKRREWMPQMKLADTHLAWTVEWLGYFEEWLLTGEWAGGGYHPTPRKHAAEICALVSIARGWSQHSLNRVTTSEFLP